MLLIYFDNSIHNKNIPLLASLYQIPTIYINFMLKTLESKNKSSNT